MSRRTPIFCALLFATGLAGGWLIPRPGPAEVAALRSSPAVVARQRSLTPSEMPAPSGLPGDLSHLSRISDTRTLRAIWKKGSWDDEIPLVRRWGELDPVDGLQFFLFEEVNGAPRSTQYALEMAELWAERDPDAYLKFVSGLPGVVPFALVNPLWAIFEKRMNADTGAFLAYLKTAPAPLQNASYRSVFRHLFKKDPARALVEAQQVPESWDGDPWADAYDTSNPALVLPAFVSSGAASRNSYSFSRLVDSLAAKDLAAAQEIVAKLPPGEPRREAAQAIVAKMLEKDPEAALAWLEAHAPTAKNRHLVAEALLKTDPARAFAMGSSNALWSDSQSLMRYSAKLAKNDWAGVVALIRSSPPGMRKTLIQGIMKPLGWQDLAKPLPQLDKVSEILLGVDSNQNLLDRTSFEYLDTRHAPAVRAWLGQQPQAVQQALLAPLANTALEESPATAATWLAGLAASETRTTELIRATARWADEAPQSAADFCLTLPPGTDQDYAILNTAIAWHHNNPAAARAWVNVLPDSPAKIKTLAEINQP